MAAYYNCPEAPLKAQVLMHSQGAPTAVQTGCCCLQTMGHGGPYPSSPSLPSYRTKGQPNHLVPRWPPTALIPSLSPSPPPSPGGGCAFHQLKSSCFQPGSGTVFLTEKLYLAELSLDVMSLLCVWSTSVAVLPTDLSVLFAGCHLNEWLQPGHRACLGSAG